MVPQNATFSIYKEISLLQKEPWFQCQMTVDNISVYIVIE